MNFVLSIAEILFARVLPGALQLGSILILGRLLSPQDYGAFSTGLATVAFFTIIATGPVQFSIIPRHADFATRGKQDSFEGCILYLLVLATGLVGIAAFIIVSISIFETSWIGLAIASSLYTGWLPVLRARLQFWRFGLAAFVNAFLILFFILFIVYPNPTVSGAVWALSLGNSIGFIFGWFLCGAPLPSIPERSSIKNLLGVGAAYTGSRAAEDGLFLGTRYAILWFGTAEFLGFFSFAVDVALRSVGVAINVVSFALVPRAYKVAAIGDLRLFRKLLLRSGLAALVFSFFVFLLITILELSGLLGLLVGSSFSITIFLSASIAVVINRLKKLVLDPLAVNVQKHLAIPVTYALIAPFSILLTTFCAASGMESAILVLYPLTYLLVAALLAVTIFWGGLEKW